MKCSTILASLALAATTTTTLATPMLRPRGECLCQEDAETIVTEFIGILSHAGSSLGDANTTAQALLDPNYTEISDSILSLEGLPLGSSTFTNKQSYIASVLNAPPVAGITTLEIDVAGCSKVLWYWNFLGIGTAEYEIKGFNLFTVTPARQIVQTNLEFNSIAWGLDTGYTVIAPAET